MDQPMRPAFTKQPFHQLLIDVGPPMNSESIQKICNSLTEVTVIACSIRGSCRIPMFGLTALSPSSIKCLFHMQQIRNNFPHISFAISELCSMIENDMTAAHFTGDKLKTIMKHGIDEAIHQFRLKNKKNGEVNHLQITLISSQPLRILTKDMKEVIRTVDLADIKKIQILAITSDSRAEPDFTNEMKDDTNTSDEEVTLDPREHYEEISELVDVATLQCNSAALDGFFKEWLHDCTTEKEHVQLHLPSPDNAKGVVIKCDIHEPLLNPGAFIYNNLYHINTDPLLASGPLVNATKMPECKDLPIYKLHTVSFVPNDSLCESVLFGMPFIIHPTFCWKADWTELEDNRQLFLSLRQLLNERDTALLLRAMPASPVAQLRNTSPNGYFAVFASEKAAMLIKPVACRELLLPPRDVWYDDSTVSVAAKATVESCMTLIPNFDHFNPMCLQSGLLSSLKLSLMNAKPSQIKTDLLRIPLSKPSMTENHANNMPDRIKPCFKPIMKNYKGFQPASEVFARKFRKF